MTNKYISYNNFNYEVTIKRIVNTSRITLKPTLNSNNITITVPKYFSDSRAMEYAKKHVGVIHEHMQNNYKINFYESDFIPILGSPHKLNLINEAKPFKIYIQNNEIIVSGNLQKYNLNKKIAKFLKDLAKNYFTSLTDSKCRDNSITYSKISVKDTVSRWGSCSSNKNLAYNFRLIMAPHYVIDYIISHEVAHIVHFNHSKAFWELVEYLCPHFEESKDWIKLNSSSLNKYIAI